MSPTGKGTSKGKRRFGLALAGLVLALASPVFWALSVHSNFLLRTALLMWIAQAVGLGCAILSALYDARIRTRLIAALTVLFVIFAVPAYLVVTRLPPPAVVSTAEPVPNVMLADHLGTPVSLPELLEKGWVLLVFYRGFW